MEPENQDEWGPDPDNDGWGEEDGADGWGNEDEDDLDNASAPAMKK